MNSIWSEYKSMPSFPSLGGDRQTDVLVIGGGLAGLLCAYKLNRAGVNCIVAEAGRICGGVTENTTAKITAQHGMIYSGLLRSFGREKASMYLHANEQAVAEYRALCESIDCDFEEKDNTVYTLKNRKRAEKEMRALERLGYNAEFSENLPLPITAQGAVTFKNQAQFNPLKFASAISGELNIYEHTRIIEIRGKQAFTEHGTISADSFVVATHFPFINKFGAYPFKMYQERSYSVALEGGPKLGGMFVDEEQKGMSFRNYKDFLLIGGGDHRTGRQGGCYSEIRTFQKLHYPSLREKYAWAAQDCMTFDGVPYIGRYSKRLPDMFVATGFNKWGMTSSMVSADIISDMILGRKNEFAPVFSPSRNFIKPKLAVHLAEVIAGFLGITKKRCPHMGCALRWNPAEYTWDCACHGSRFSEDGALLDGPSQDNIDLS